MRDTGSGSGKQQQRRGGLGNGGERQVIDRQIRRRVDEGETAEPTPLQLDLIQKAIDFISTYTVT